MPSILLLEPYVELRALMVEALREEPPRAAGAPLGVVAATSVAHALMILEEQTVCVAIVDIDTRIDDPGAVVLRATAERSPKAGLMAMLGVDDADDLPASTVTMRKPFQVDAFVRLVHEMCRRASS